MTYQLHHGDCLEFMRTLPAGSVDAVVTDPPYGVGLVKKTSDYRWSANFDNGESLKASSTYKDDPEHVKWLIKEFVPEVLRVAKRALIYCGAAMLFNYPEPDGIGCVYSPSGAGSSKWGFQCFHPILYYGKDLYLQTGKGRRPNSFQTVQPNKEKIDHPCPKPVEWMTWAVKRVSFEGMTVFDPFMGSGTTGVACVQTGRHFIGCEIDAGYFEIAKRRIEAAQMQPALGVTQ